MENKKIVLTGNMVKLVDCLKEENDFLSASEIKAKYNLEKSVQSINGSLSASAYNGKLFNKDTKALDNKLVKCYKLTDNYKDFIK